MATLPASNNRYLTEEQANYRLQAITQGSIVYNVYLHLRADAFTGNLTATFDTPNVSDDLFIDFKNQSIDRVVLNGTQVRDVKWNGLFLTLPKDLLRAQNQLIVDFSCKYARDGSGLHSFTDTDGKQYLYTQCESYLCNRIFPNFDQPSLKAYLDLTIKAPASWRVLSNENEVSRVAVDSTQEQVVQFPRTKLLPTYLFAIVAGPYAEVRGQNTYRNIPMNLYCRESLLPHMHEHVVALMYEATNKSLEMYENFFRTPYPFNKVDQVFCAEYNWGAMENAGLITYNDLLIPREPADPQKNTRLANVIAHELAHHWFGNLVTMRWWNDLWLNESFADFISHFCISKFDLTSKKCQDIWLTFNKRKEWGYSTDVRPTTHPIAGEVPHTEAADSIFDGITYAKGAASLRQLLALLGEEGFSLGLESYFKEFAFRNATLADFIAHLDVQFSKQNLGFTLREWQDQWIQRAGLNTVQPGAFDAAGTSLVVRQSAVLAEHATLRFHKLTVALFDDDGNATLVPALLKPQAETEVAYAAPARPVRAVLLNAADEAFVKVLLDEASFAFFRDNLYKVKSALTRAIVWNAIIDSVRDATLTSSDAVDVFVQQAPLEQNDDIIVLQFQNIVTLVNTHTPATHRATVADRLFNFTLDFFASERVRDNKELIIALKQQLAALGQSEAALNTLVAWFEGAPNVDERLKAVEPGVQLQWDIVARVAASKQFPIERKQAVFDAQAARDPSDTKNYQQEKFRALTATPEQRKELWDLYLNKDNGLSLRTLQYSWQGFNNVKAGALEYYGEWFKALPRIYDEFLLDYSKYFYIFMQPRTQDVDADTRANLIQQFKDALATVKPEHHQYKRNVLESIDEAERISRTHAFFLQRLAK